MGCFPRFLMPSLTERTLFVRQAANLWQVKAAIQPRLPQISGHAADPVQIIDTLPLPVCGYTHSGRDRCFKPWADYGHCAAKQLDYYGFKLGLRIARCGMIIDFPLLPARPHDIRLLDDLVEGFAGWVLADKGFIDAFRQALLAERHGVVVVTPPRKGMTSPHSPAVLKLCARLRKGVETVGAHLTERFAVARLRVHDLWHFHHRLIRKVLAHTVGVFLNLPDATGFCGWPRDEKIVGMDAPQSATLWSDEQHRGGEAAPIPWEQAYLRGVRE